MNRERYNEEDFNSFVRELLDKKCFDNLKEEGIAKLVLDKGFDTLSDKQKFVFENSISDYIYDECDLCGENITWSEMSAKSWLCGSCDHRMSKDD
ncbi:MAG: hypothetical protein RIS64_4480 [Bacteroidota bacterium]|jgi:hypothetical protein